MPTSGIHGSTAIPNFAPFYNSEIFSDITIFYGDNYDRVFHGHRVVLVSQSEFFKSLFNANLLNGEPKAVVQIVTDKPDTFATVLKSAYGAPHTSTETSLNRIKNLHDCIAQYGMAHEIGFLYVKAQLAAGFARSLKTFILENALQDRLPQCADFVNLAESVYLLSDTDTDGPHGNLLSHSLMDTLLVQFSIHPAALHPVTLQVPEFGRDLVAHIYNSWLDKVLPSFEPICPVCSGIFPSLTDGNTPPKGKFRTSCGRCDKSWNP